MRTEFTAYVNRFHSAPDAVKYIFDKMMDGAAWNIEIPVETVGINRGLFNYFSLWDWNMEFLVKHNEIKIMGCLGPCGLGYVEVRVPAILWTNVYIVEE